MKGLLVACIISVLCGYSTARGTRARGIDRGVWLGVAVVFMTLNIFIQFYVK